jgi:ADP-heptose:LPS heptosyltransferase
VPDNHGVIPNIRFKYWKKSHAPKKILAIRFQALGDTVATLPYLQSLKHQNPEIILHLITREEVCAIPKSIDLFDKVITIGGKRNAKLQFILTLLKVPYLWFQRYDVVLDLQKHKISIILRKLLATTAWAEYDKYSPISGSERFRLTIEALGLWKINIDTRFKINIDADSILRSTNWRTGYDIVALNPAGSFPSRNWPLDYYITFAKLWLEKLNPKTQFVLLLLPSIQEKADYIAQHLGDHCIDLTGKASQAEAFAILQKCKFILSEDGGLMHMAWVQGIPTLALFSSSRKDWSAPQGKWSDCLDSSDLECGPCELEICKYGDNRCLTRYDPTFVFSRAAALLKGNL